MKDILFRLYSPKTNKDFIIFPTSIQDDIYANAVRIEFDGEDFYCNSELFTIDFIKSHCLPVEELTEDVKKALISIKSLLTHIDIFYD